jgi:hypothetical protein
VEVDDAVDRYIVGIRNGKVVCNGRQDLDIFAVGILPVVLVRIADPMIQAVLTSNPGVSMRYIVRPCSSLWKMETEFVPMRLLANVFVWFCRDRGSRDSRS